MPEGTVSVEILEQIEQDESSSTVDILEDTNVNIFSNEEGAYAYA
jgi:hypothetical protein